MNLTEYIKHASGGARVHRLAVRGKPIVAHAWRATVLGEPGWEYVLADYHGNLLGQAWTRGGTDERDQDVAESIEKLLGKVAAKAVA